MTPTDAKRIAALGKKQGLKVQIIRQTHRSIRCVFYSTSETHVCSGCAATGILPSPLYEFLERPRALCARWLQVAMKTSGKLRFIAQNALSLFCEDN